MRCALRFSIEPGCRARAPGGSAWAFAVVFEGRCGAQPRPNRPRSERGAAPLPPRGGPLGTWFFFWPRTALKDRPKGPPTANRQPPPAATNRQRRPTANHYQPPPTTNHQPPTAANHHQPPPTASRRLPIATNRQLPIATNHG